jgi:hypothetical protein
VVAVGRRDELELRVMRGLAEQPLGCPGDAQELERRQAEALALKLQPHLPDAPFRG